jgi:hypothetical protein
VDEWYAEDLQETVKEIDRVVRTALDARETVEFSYNASW